jgi:hypothetical protein
MYKVCSMAEHSIDAVYNYDVSLLTYPNSTQDTVSVCVCVCLEQTRVHGAGQLLRHSGGGGGGNKQAQEVGQHPGL